MLLIKRYGAPLLLVAVLYSIVYALFGRPAPYFGAGLLVVLMLAYLMRTCDDLCDYTKDKAQGRAPIGRGVLILLCCLLGAAVPAVSLSAGQYLMLVPLGLILLQLVLPERWRDYIKPLFLPAVVVALVYGAFSPNAWVFALAAVLAGADVIIILMKKKGDKKHDPD